jgi:hypothetical protein
MEGNTVFLGTEIKLNIHIDPIDGLTMKDDFLFTIEAYCSPKNSITIEKDKAIPVENSKDDYIILIDTYKVGTGTLKCKVIAEIPDGDFDNDYRTEVSIIDTGINIVKSI